MQRLPSSRLPLFRLSSYRLPSYRLSQGFTLLELLVALAIFAVLVVSGWQVFDSMNRSKARSEAQTQTLSQLQYAYQQLQRDMMQVVPYNLINPANQNSVNQSSMSQNSAARASTSQQNSFQLRNNVLSFVRYADPDPRYQEVPTLERIEYHFSEDKLIRRRYSELFATDSSGNASVPQDSQILTDVEGGLIRTLLPEPSIIYPNEETDLENNANRLDKAMLGGAQNGEGSRENTQSFVPKPSLPKGVAVSFNVQMGAQSTPIQWHFALPAMPPEPLLTKDTGQ